MFECLKQSHNDFIGAQLRVLTKCHEGQVSRAPQGLCGRLQRLHVWVTWKCLSSPPCVISINNKGPDGGNLLAYFWVPGFLVSHSARKTAPLYTSLLSHRSKLMTWLKCSSCHLQLIWDCFSERASWLSSKSTSL